MNINLLKGHICAAGLTQADVAEKIGISLSRFNAKVNERKSACFDLRELRAIRQVLGLSDRDFCEIFLQNEAY